MEDLRGRLAGTGLRLAHLDDLTAHYPPTLRAWERGVREHRDELLEAGYSDDFLRLWRYYLAYCEGGFLERAIGDVHLLLAGREARMDGRVPAAPAFPDGMPSFVGPGGGTPGLDADDADPADLQGVA